MSNNKIIQAFVDRIDEFSKTVSVLYRSADFDFDEANYDETVFSLDEFAEQPKEGDIIPIYAESLKLAVPNTGKTIFCEVEYLVSSGNDSEVYKKEFKLDYRLSGIYGDKKDSMRLKEIRKKFWKKCINEKKYLEETNKNSSVFIKRSLFWTDKFYYKEVFTEYLKNISYEKGQNSYINDSDPELVPNAF